MTDVVEVLPRRHLQDDEAVSLATQCVAFREIAREIWWRAQREPLSAEDRKNLGMGAFDAEHTLQANPATTIKEEAA